MVDSKLVEDGEQVPVEEKAEVGVERVNQNEDDENDKEESNTKRFKGNLRGMEWYKSIGSPKYICAPMVDQSDLPFRILTHKYGCDMAYTPMFHSRHFAEQETYRRNHWQTCAEDKHVVAQFCGDDADVLTKAASFIQHEVDAVDLNFGCPQGIARKGHYGSFLLSEPDLCTHIVSTMSKQLSCPVTAKIRCVNHERDYEDTMKLVYSLQAAGASVITIHGRTKEEKGHHVKECNWDIIKRIKDSLHIPVFSNGGIETFEDVQKCLDFTGCDGVMSSEALLENPALFSNKFVPQETLAREYLELVEKHPFPGQNWKKIVKKHLFQFLYAGLQNNTDLRSQLGSASTMQNMKDVVKELSDRRANPVNEHWPAKGWYRRYRDPLGDRSEKEAKKKAREAALKDVTNVTTEVSADNVDKNTVVQTFDAAASAN